MERTLTPSTTQSTPEAVAGQRDLSTDERLVRTETDVASRALQQRRHSVSQEQLKDELERFKKEINLVQFAQRFGYGAGEKQVEKSGHYWRLRKSKGDQIIVTRNSDRHWVWINPAGSAPDSTDRVKRRADQLKQLCVRRGMEVSEDVATFIASRVADDGVERAVLHIAARANSSQQTITEEMAAASLRVLKAPKDYQQGTIIDFLRRETGGSLADVCRQLRQDLGIVDSRQTAAPAAPAHGSHEPPTEDKAGFNRERVTNDFLSARVVKQNFYLSSRGLRPETLADPRFEGTFRFRPVSGEVLFPHHDPDGITGFERKHPARGTMFASGGKRAVWHSRAFTTDRVLVISESAVDSMSFHQLHPRGDARYMSTGGTLSRYQLALLERAIAKMPPDSTLVIATDNDWDKPVNTGRQMAEVIRALAQKANPQIQVDTPLPPAGLKDWNDVVKEREQEFIRRSVRTKPRSVSR
jgi:hypothetical protein